MSENAPVQHNHMDKVFKTFDYFVGTDDIRAGRYFDADYQRTNC